MQVGLVRGAPVAVLCLLLLAGCSSGANSEPPPAPKYQLPEVVIEEESPYGAIRGVVLEITIKPIPFANITLHGPNQTVQANADGGFVFENLLPGFYYFTGSLKGYVTTTSQVEVFQGKAAVARIGLPRLPFQEPYHLTEDFQGYIEAGGYLADIGEYYWDIPVNGQATAFTLEAKWPQNICALSDTMYYNVYNLAGGRDSYSGRSSNPMHVILNRTSLEWRLSDEFRFEVSSDQDCPRFEMTYDVYITVWHNGPADPNWSYIAGDK